MAIRYGHFIEADARNIRICRDNTVAGVSFSYPNNAMGAAQAAIQMRRLRHYAKQMEINCLFQAMFSRSK